MKKITVITLFLLFSPANAYAGNLFAHVQCLENINSLKIDVFFTNGALERANAIESKQSLWEEDQIVLYDTLVENPDVNSQISRPIETQCTLKEKDNSKKTYSISLEPYFFNVNPQWECGRAKTFEVTIKAEEKILVDRFRFWYDCSGLYGSYQDDKIITTLLFQPHDKSIDFSGYYNNPKEYEDHIFYEVFEKTYSLEDKLPITSELIYSNKD